MDLNLIRIFTTIYESKSITESAKILNVTQPSISYSLKKLRQNFNDELFIRSHTTMLPTTKAEKIYKTFKSVLHDIDDLIWHEEQFNIGQAKGKIKIAVSDLGALFFIPYIYKRLNLMAPHVQLDVIQLDNKTIKNSMLNKDVDLCICNKTDHLNMFQFDSILKDEYIGIVDKHQNLEGLQLQDYCFISVSSHAGHKCIEDWMHKNALNIKMRVPNFNLLESVIKNHKHIAIVPYTLTKHLHTDIHIIDLPFDFPVLEVGIYRSQYSFNNKICEWIVNLISSHNWYY